MKPTYDETGYATMDLTMCPVHVRSDGAIVAMVPMKWIAGELHPALAANGETVNYRHYAVTEWQEVVLAPPGTAVQPKPNN